MKESNKNIENEFFLSQWIEGNLTDTELKNLVSESDFNAFKKLKEGLAIYAELDKPLDDSFKNIQHKIASKKEVKVRTLNYKWIASIAAMIIFFVGFYTVLGSDAVLNSTNFGEQKTVALLDGSQVILNAKSAINYSKKDWKTNREVFLTGEAFFKVKKGSKFTVKTKNGEVTVLGTEFTVNATDDFFEVICFSGKVAVLHNDKKYVLTPTKAFRKINGNAIEDLEYTEKTPTWVLGESSYKSVPLKYVIADFEKQYNIKINSDKIDNLVIYTGSFDHKNIDLALKTVFATLDVIYKKSSSKLIILDK